MVLYVSKLMFYYLLKVNTYSSKLHSISDNGLSFNVSVAGKVLNQTFCTLPENYRQSMK